MTMKPFAIGAAALLSSVSVAATAVAGGMEPADTNTTVLQRGVTPAPMIRPVPHDHSAPLAGAPAHHGQTMVASGPAPSFPGGSLPGQAQAGECYAQILIPAQFETQTQVVEVAQGYETVSLTEPRFEERTQQIEVKPAGERLVVREAVYEARQEQVMVRPGYERMVVNPAKFQTITETVQVSPPRLEWQLQSQVTGPIRATRHDPSTGAIWCLVEVPGETRTVTRQVVVEPASASGVAAPPEFRTVTKQVLVQPATVERIPTPPQYATITTHALVAPAQEIRTAVPPRTETVTTRVQVAPATAQWTPVLCDVNATPQAIRDVQISLRDLGFYRGPIDGILGPQTYAGVRAFQDSRGIPHQGFLTMDTLRAMGVLAGPATVTPTAQPVAPVQPAVQPAPNGSYLQPTTHGGQ